MGVVTHGQAPKFHDYDISDFGQNVGADNGAFWNPSPQPAMPWGSNGIPATKDPEGFVNGLYEPLRAKYPNYITRTVMGLDSSNTLNCYRYELTPKHYSKTIIVSGGTHGNEYTASFGLARFIHLLVNEWKNYPQLAYIRKNVRVIVVPIVNPWSFKNNKRQNYNGVDLNRNMEFAWQYLTGASFQVGGTYYKGTAPYSEKETQYMMDTFDEFSEAVSYLDFHTINTIAAEHIVFTPRYRSQFRNIFNDPITRMFKTGNRIVNGTTAMPTVAMQASVSYNMTTANPEWYNGLYGGNRDTIEMTEAVKFFGNIIIKASGIEHKTNRLDESEPFSKLLVYEKGATPLTLTSTSGNYNNVPHATFDMTIKRHGILKVSGYLKVTTTAPTLVGVNPIVYQVNHPEMGFSAVSNKNYNEVVQNLGIGTFVIPFNARFHVFPNNHNTETSARPEQVKFRIRFKMNAGTVTYEAWRAYLDFTPSERGFALEIVDFTGLEANAEGSDFATLYPDPTKYGIDLVMEE